MDRAGEFKGRYRDRSEAGEVLASMMEQYKGGKALVLAIPNGGVAVGTAIAKTLGLELGLMVVRKIQFPDNTEAGFGAVGADGTTVLDERLVKYWGLSQQEVAAQKEKAFQSVRERLKRFGDLAGLPVIKGRTAILVDDGLASGSTMAAAVAMVRAHGPDKVVVAVPTASHRAWVQLRKLADDFICPHVSRLPFFAVADAYQRWYDLDEEEVIHLMESLLPK